MPEYEGFATLEEGGHVAHRALLAIIAGVVGDQLLSTLEVY